MKYIKTFENTIAKCKSCGYSFNYLSVPESGMGYVKCPKCNEPVTQKALEGIRSEYPDMFASLKPEDMPQDVPGFDGTIDPNDDGFSYKTEDEEELMTDTERYKKFLEVTKKRNIQETEDEIIINTKRLGEDFYMTVSDPRKHLREFLNKELRGKYISKGYVTLREDGAPKPGFIEGVNVFYDVWTAFINFKLKGQDIDDLDFCESPITIDKIKSTANLYNL